MVLLYQYYNSYVFFYMTCKLQICSALLLHSSVDKAEIGFAVTFIIVQS